MSNILSQKVALFLSHLISDDVLNHYLCAYKHTLISYAMKSENVKLSQIKVNEANPRTITQAKFDKLINSILVLPKMLDLRPIVVDETFVALGGNMRYRALTAIATMSHDEIAKRLAMNPDYRDKTEAEKHNLQAYWVAWQEEPTAPIVRASALSEGERKEFIVKDNSSFGAWDMDVLANEWDAETLDRWGVDVWQDAEDEIRVVKDRDDEETLTFRVTLQQAEHIKRQIASVLHYEATNNGCEYTEGDALYLIVKQWKAMP